MIRGLLVILCLWGPLAHAQLPPPFVAEYRISMGLLSLGKAERELRRDGDGLIYISRSRTAGMLSWLVKEDLTETSRVEWMNGRVRPLLYHRKRIGRKNQDIEQRFDWQQGKVYSRINGELHVFDLPSDGLDQNMYQLSLMVDLAAGKRSMDYAVAGNEKFRRYPIRMIGRESVDTPWGRLETLVIQRKEKKVTTTMWCAPRLYYLPVRIGHEEKGNRFTAELQSLRGMQLLPRAE